MGILAKHEKIILLQLARRALERCARGQDNSIEITDQASLKEIVGAFVTLHRNGELRGCIGRIQAVSPLEEIVQKMAIAAASRDPRFPAVQDAELANLEIEISVLSPMRLIEDLDEIEIGKDGLMISAGGKTGLLLPQVALEHRWNRTEFLQHTCIKAGLSQDYWQHAQPKIEAFRAEVFSESGFNPSEAQGFDMLSV